MRTVLLLSCFLLIKISYSADTLVISDIDDTLKVSATAIPKEAIKRTILVDARFSGMALLLKELMRLPNSKISYVSAAPKFLSRFHAAFLKAFPNGNLYLRDQMNDDVIQYKLSAINREIKNNKPKTIILIGDNSTFDPHVYDKVARAYQNRGIRVITFIRHMYSDRSKILFGQIPFIVPAEIGIHLANLKVVTKSWADFFAKSEIRRVLADRKRYSTSEQYFPSFQDCRNYRWTLGDGYRFLRAKIRDICAKAPQLLEID